MTQPREDLEREIKSLKDRLDYCVEAASRASVAFQVLVPEAQRKTRGYKLNFAVLRAIAKEPSWVAPSLAALCRVGGIAFAMEQVLEVGRDGGDEWKAACRVIIEKLKKHCE